MKAYWKRHTGAWIGLAIIALWVLSLSVWLTIPVSFSSPWIYIGILVQTHLYTGLFITAHDAMHGVVSANRRVNKIIGFTAALLFAYNWYPRLHRKHHQHHRFVATEEDPDYHKGGFLPWYISFARQYVVIWQIVAMAATYHTLLLFFDRPNLILFWIIPSVLSTLQLFYFGTYLPHKGEHSENNKYKSRSQSKNHVIAFFTCYFFGYHYEHHASPATPWWKLWKVKEKFHTHKS
ncbi:fatty acid desaturase [Roseivirga sp. BDSF3-8]|uniref:fatty acid desaturase n=1 Tax=Roseivirga sp. BDSF3-8 TaxID=3241598 RepID=UPI003531B053